MDGFDYLETRDSFKIVVLGSIYVNTINEELDKFIRELDVDNVEILMGEYTPEEKDLISRSHKLNFFTADWSKYGEHAPYYRDEKMIGCADACLIVTNGKNLHSNSIVNFAQDLNLILKIIDYSVNSEEGDFVHGCQ